MNDFTYPLFTRCLHWLSALLIVALFFSGWYMVDLDYYSEWYQTLPALHFLGGVLLLFLWLLMIIRLWTIKNKPDNSAHQRWERIASACVKQLFYWLVTLMVITGYLMATADGETLVLFEVIKLPAISRFTAEQIDTMGWLHEYAAYAIMVLAVVHALGALKHHLIDKDNTLKRMT